MWILFGLCLGLSVTLPIFGAVDAVDHFRTRLLDHLQEHAGTGAGYAVVSGKTLVYGGVGLRDRNGGGREVTQDTAFPVASVSKLVTALAVHRAAEKSLFALNDPVQRYLNDPNLFVNPFPQPVLIRHLLDHTSGFTELIAPAPENRVGFYPPVIELIQSLRKKPVVRCHPGLVPTYSNFNYVLLMHLLEKVSGQTFDEFVRQEVLLPAGMTRTSFRIAHYDDDNVAQGYRSVRGQYQPVQIQEGFYRPAAGMISTPADLSRLLYLLVNDGEDVDGTQVFSRKVIGGLEQIEGQLAHATGMRVGHASGLVIREKNGHLLFGHNGITDGHMAAAFYNREDRFAVAVLYNSHLLPAAPSLSFAVGAAMETVLADVKPHTPLISQADAPGREIAGLYQLENPRFEIMRFQPFFTGYMLIKHGDGASSGEYFQSDILGRSSRLIPYGQKTMRFAYESYGHIGFVEHEGKMFALDSPNRLYRKLSPFEFAFGRLPLLVCFGILVVGGMLFFLDALMVLFIRSKPKPSGSHEWPWLVPGYAPQIGLLLVVLSLPFLTDSYVTTSISWPAAFFFLATTSLLPLCVYGLLTVWNRFNVTKNLWAVFYVCNNAAGLICFLVLARFGFFAVWPGYFP